MLSRILAAERGMVFRKKERSRVRMARLIGGRNMVGDGGDCIPFFVWVFRCMLDGLQGCCQCIFLSGERELCGGLVERIRRVFVQRDLHTVDVEIYDSKDGFLVLLLFRSFNVKFDANVQLVCAYRWVFICWQF